LCAATGAQYAVAVANGTAALHLAVLALGVRPGDIGLTSPITFVASANCIVYAGGNVRFVDVDPESALIRVDELERDVKRLCAAGRAPRLIVPVNITGHVADLPAVQRIAATCGAKVLEDAAHSLGATYTHAGRKYRSASCTHSDAAILSFHPVKHITTGEGGAVLTNDPSIARTVRNLRNHGIHRDSARLKRQDQGPWYYEQETLGFNYRVTDLQCALGLSQLKKLDRFVKRRRELAARYDSALSGAPLAEKFKSLATPTDQSASYHLYVVRVRQKSGESLVSVAARRKSLFMLLRESHIHAQVHYIPVPWQPYYQARLGTKQGDFPGAEEYYASCLSLPMYPKLTNAEQDRVIAALAEAPL
jgi:dTDP-4-amino-4,6-dideoxygalactose transaminase